MYYITRDDDFAFHLPYAAVPDALAGYSVTHADDLSVGQRRCIEVCREVIHRHPQLRIFDSHIILSPDHLTAYTTALDFNLLERLADYSHPELWWSNINMIRRLATIESDELPNKMCRSCFNVDTTIYPDGECPRCSEGYFTCECWHRRCAGVYSRDEQCGICSSHSNHCTCYYCDECGRYSSDGCCEYGCDIESDPDERPRYNNGLIYYADPHAKQHSITRLCGCELEISNSSPDMSACRDLARSGRISIENDGSLPSTGSEIVTQPASGRQFIDLIESVARAFDNDDAAINVRCGFHLHVDCRDLQYYDIYKFMRVWVAVEDEIFSYLAPSRQDNHYCQRVSTRWQSGINYLIERHIETKRAAWKDYVAWAAYDTYDAKCINRYRKSQKPGGRYKAVNIHSWLYRGTIEFRCHHGTTSAKKTIRWAELMCRLIDWTVAASLKDITALSDMSSADAVRHIVTDEIWEYYQQRKLAVAV